MKYLISALCLGFVLSVSAASAETKAAPKPRSAKSIECSKLADAKNLHGKERKVFRAKCKKGEPTT
jgi:psiF repeat